MIGEPWKDHLDRSEQHVIITNVNRGDIYIFQQYLRVVALPTTDTLPQKLVCNSGILHHSRSLIQKNLRFSEGDN